MFKKLDLINFLERFPPEKREKLTLAYISSYEKHMDVCKSAIQNDEIEPLKHALHDLKSLSYTLGANALGTLAEKAEEKALDGAHADALKQAPEIFPYIKNIIAIMNEYLATKHT